MSWEPYSYYEYAITIPGACNTIPSGRSYFDNGASST